MYKKDQDKFPKSGHIPAHLLGMAFSLMQYLFNAFCASYSNLHLHIVYNSVKLICQEFASRELNQPICTHQHIIICLFALATLQLGQKICYVIRYLHRLF